MSDFIVELSQFHFLRPYWLLLLLLVPVIYHWSKHYHEQSSSWAQAIDRHLLGYLLEQQSVKSSRLPFYLVIISLLLTAIALAGPVWKKIPQPVHKKEDALVILLDLSLSMQSNDIPPSRLIKAQHKLIDILDQRDQGQTALVVYAGDAHIVAPLTDDTHTIKAMVPALSPLLMPALGSRPDLALKLAQQLLKDGGINEGRILLITDGISSEDANELSDILKTHHLSVLAVGTPEGGPIPIPEQGFLKQGQEIVIAKMALEPMQELARMTGARLAQLQIDDSDIHYLLKNEILNLNATSRQVEREFDQWQEMGPWLLLLLAPLAALSFRRGWLLSIGLIFLIDPSPAFAFGWNDLWQTRDQQGAAALHEGDAKRAAELFDSKAWKASAAYQAGDYQNAAKNFATQDTANGHYNRGNALAKAGQLKEAIAAYEQALEKAPQHEDARFNKKLVEQLIQQQQQNQENGQNSEDDQQNPQDQAANDQQQGAQNSPQQSDQDPPNSSQPPEQQNAESGEDTQNSTQQADSSSPNDTESTRENTENSAKQSQTEKQPESAQTEQPEAEADKTAMMQADAQSDEQHQAMEQWLRRIPEDPGGLLRRKFNYQYQQRQLENQFQPPQENQPIW